MTELREDDVIYLLYDGQSEDGRGTPDYCGWTTSLDVATSHAKRCRKNPYSIGRVMVLTKHKERVLEVD